MELRPLLATRIANTAPGAAVALLAWPLAEELAGYAALAGLVPVAVGAALSVRGYRMSVSVGRERITVRGLLRSRTIPREDIESLTSYPALKWRSGSGRHVYTPLTAFWEAPGVLSAVQAHNDACLGRLSQALRHG
ncbi:PH domain-containing protein [Micromonospora sp. SL4-19]|uniref:PH domain-containing protein n=1 Tax=Micromonospora sp. SL4-19 TaxID=3399129 RepID=UPI003A4E3F57